MKKKIVVINGHPDEESFNAALAAVYCKQALDSGAEVRYIAIGELSFNPNLQFGYRKRMVLEPDLVRALSDLAWSDHQVWIHPLWWLGMPAILKGFFDRAFLPGITFSRNADGISQGLWRDKTARVITTAGDLTLADYERIYKSSGEIQLQKGILQYCGVKNIESQFIGPMQEMQKSDREMILREIQQLAIRDVKCSID